MVALTLPAQKWNLPRLGSRALWETTPREEGFGGYARGRNRTPSETSGNLTLERHRDLLRRGTTLIDPNDPGEDIRVLVYLEHGVQDARTDHAGNRRMISRQMQFVEIKADGNTQMAGYAPYLNYRPLEDDEKPLCASIADEPWLKDDLEPKVLAYAVTHLVPSHFEEVRHRKEELATRTIAAVKERLTKEITYWDHRAATLKEQELAGRGSSRLNSGLAAQRRDDLTTRLQKRLAELEQERRLSPMPPVVLGGALIVPAGLLAKLRGSPVPTMFARDTKRIEQLAMNAVFAAEQRLGFIPTDVSDQKLGWDIESSIPNTGRLRFIEVKGRVTGAETVTVTKNEIMAGLNKPDDFILAVVAVDGDATSPRYIRRPFQREPDFAATSVNYDLGELITSSEEPS